MSGEGERLAARGGQIPCYGVLTVAVPNEGSAARDHLANEITFLGLIRTAAGLVSLGLVVAKFDAAGTGQSSGGTLVLLGAALALFALRRYFQVSVELQAGGHVVTKKGATIVAVFLGVAAVFWCIIASSGSDGRTGGTSFPSNEQNLLPVGARL